MSETYDCAKFMFDKERYFSANQLAKDFNVSVADASQLIHRIKKSEWYQVQTKKINGTLYTKVIRLKDLTKPIELDPMWRLAHFGER